VSQVVESGAAAALSPLPPRGEPRPTPSRMLPEGGG